MALSLEQRFWAKVNKEGPTQPHMDTPCWEWTAGCTNGYGMIRDDRGKQIHAHRVPYLLETGKRPEYIRHKCDNRLCVRPDHLIPTSAADGPKLNSQEAYDRGRRTATKGGSKRTAEDIKEIRRRCANGESQATVGKSYGIDQSTVSRIVRLTSWRDVL